MIFAGNLQEPGPVKNSDSESDIEVTYTLSTAPVQPLIHSLLRREF